MANPGSFGKRENEKKKHAQRLAKQKKKEERKNSSAGGSFENMIAYVDAHGNITDTPPELQVKEEIDLESIEIATPKKVDEGPLELKGRVEHFNSDKGYGFIKELSSTEKYFFHISSAPQNIAEGNIVIFELERGTRGMNAVRIKMA